MEGRQRWLAGLPCDKHQKTSRAEANVRIQVRSPESWARGTTPAHTGHVFSLSRWRPAPVKVRRDRNLQILKLDTCNKPIKQLLLLFVLFTNEETDREFESHLPRSEPGYEIVGI